MIDELPMREPIQGSFCKWDDIAYNKMNEIIRAINDINESLSAFKKPDSVVIPTCDVCPCRKEPCNVDRQSPMCIERIRHKLSI